MEKDIRRCEVCGNVREVFVRSSACGPISLAYCEDCLRKGLEPYYLLIANLSVSGISSYEETAKWYREVIDCNLAYYNKTIDEFNADLAEDIRKQDEYWAYYERESIGALEVVAEIDEI